MTESRHKRQLLRSNLRHARGADRLRQSTHAAIAETAVLRCRPRPPVSRKCAKTTTPRSLEDPATSDRPCRLRSGGTWWSMIVLSAPSNVWLSNGRYSRVPTLNVAGGERRNASQAPSGEVEVEV